MNDGADMGAGPLDPPRNCARAVKRVSSLSKTRSERMVEDSYAC
jgi:hypothetical protein